MTTNTQNGCNEKQSLIGWLDDFISCQHDKIDDALYTGTKEAVIKAEGRLEVLYKIKNKINNNDS